MLQGDLFTDLEKADYLTALEEIHKCKAKIKRYQDLIKRLQSKLENNEHKVIRAFEVGTHVVRGKFSVTVTEVMPDCRPKWKDEFINLATTFQIDAEIAAAKVIERVRRTLKSYKTLSVSKIDASHR